MGTIKDYSQSSLKALVDENIPIDRLSKLQIIFGYILEFHQRRVDLNYLAILNYLMKNIREREYGGEVRRFFKPLLENYEHGLKENAGVSRQKSKKSKSAERRNLGIVKGKSIIRGEKPSGMDRTYDGIWSEGKPWSSSWGDDPLTPPPLEE